MDTVKGVACILVVLIHYNWGGEVSNALKAVGRFAVPYFYFLSGYYLPDREGVLTRDNLGRKLTRTWKLLLKSALIYAVFCVYWNSIMDSSWNLWTFTKEKITRDWLIKLMLSCDPAVYAHFWYLIASVLCHGVLWAACKPLESKRVFYPLLFGVLLCVYSMFAEFNELLGLKNFVYYTEKSRLVVSNTFMLRAMPFILFGICLKKYNIAEKKPLPGWLLLILAALGCLMAVLEDRRFGVTLMYTGTHLTTVSLALLSIWYPGKRIAGLGYIGGKLSMYVYIYHIAVGKMVDLGFAKLHLWGNIPLKTMRPLIVLAGSLVFAAVLVWLESRPRRGTAK
jgi:hypothetical protein